MGKQRFRTAAYIGFKLFPASAVVSNSLAVRTDGNNPLQSPDFTQRLLEFGILFLQFELQPPQRDMRIDPGQDFLRPEGFGDVIDASQRKGQNFIICIVLRKRLEDVRQCWILNSDIHVDRYYFRANACSGPQKTAGRITCVHPDFFTSPFSTLRAIPSDPLIVTDNIQSNVQPSGCVCSCSKKRDRNMPGRRSHMNSDDRFVCSFHSTWNTPPFLLEYYFISNN